MDEAAAGVICEDYEEEEMRLIDADALKYKQQVMYKKDGSDDVWAEWFTTATEINNAPAIDAEPVVRCKDCKNWTEWENGAGSCQRSDSVMWFGTDATDFCSFAERKDNE